MVQATDQNILAALDKVLAERRGADPESSYVAALYDKGLNKILEKLGEEATEVIIAAKDCDSRDSPDSKDSKDIQAQNQTALVGEVADLWFHSMILLSAQGLSSTDVLSCLAQRFGVSGHEEKAARTGHS